MFDNIIARVQKRKILLHIDPLLYNKLSPKYVTNQPIELTFDVFDLVLAIGLSRTVRVTNKVKFTDAGEFLERFIKTHKNELRILIDHNDTDVKESLSEYIGAGLSIIIAEQLYSLKRSNISKIKRESGSKPDFEGYNNNLKVIWEAKGSINPFNKSQIEHAKEQKENPSLSADCRFASFAHLKSDNITEVEIVDPLTFRFNRNELEQHTAKAKHYASLFNFIGQSELSRYFKMMVKRLKYDTNFDEFEDKIKLYKKIKKQYVKITLNGDHYLGNLESLDNVDNSTFLYVGFDEKLLSFQGFISFEDYGDNKLIELDKNVFKISKDGLCYGYIRNLEFLKNQLGNTKPIYYKDAVSIADIDDMFTFQLVNQVSYFFEKDGFNITEDNNSNLIANKNNKYFHIKIDKNIIKPFKSIEHHIKNQKSYQVIFVTPSKLSEEDISYASLQGILIISRTQLKQIIKNKKRISDFII